MKVEILNQLLNRHNAVAQLPPIESTCEWARQVLGLLFPEFTNEKIENFEGISNRYHKLNADLISIISKLKQYYPQIDADTISTLFFSELESLYAMLLLDIEAILGGDPAAKSETEVILAYPGFYAIAHHRIANKLNALGLPVIPRIISSHAHTKTGIDIHPGASIGSYFCIDHGTGVVIGETTHIGTHVKLYQGVTLGALSVDKSMASQKRHPTIENNVVIYAGATILGGETVIGNNSVIGGNVWLTKSVAPYSVVYHKPQIEVRQADLRTDIPS